jgi:hypothetical protein
MRLYSFLHAAPSVVPSFARQTGYTCHGCHIKPPELIDEGRKFKLKGYTLHAGQTGLPLISTPPDRQKSGLDLLAYLPLSAWMEISNTGLNKPDPGTQNWNFRLPQDVSLFLSGTFSTHSGGFIQANYDVQNDLFTLIVKLNASRVIAIYGKGINGYCPFIRSWYLWFSDRLSGPMLLLTVATLVRPGHGVQPSLGNKMPAGYTNAISALLHAN